MLSEISPIEKDKHCMVSFICGIIEKTKTNLELVETEQNNGCWVKKPKELFGQPNTEFNLLGIFFLTRALVYLQSAATDKN